MACGPRGYQTSPPLAAHPGALQIRDGVGVSVRARVARVAGARDLAIASATLPSALKTGNGIGESLFKGKTATKIMLFSSAASGKYRIKMRINPNQ
jgi:hypothetical protein